MKKVYSKNFFDDYIASSRQSARIVVPLVLKFVKPKSVVDVGCGMGVWLSVFQEHGIKEILGVDGPWVDKINLLIDKSRFIQRDLKKPLEIDRQFDLVVSLEVAEHLPKESAETFVDSLTKLGPVVLFSAAIPCQCGTRHINEQWPEYWTKFFKEKGYVVVDCIRKRIWNNDKVDYWYAQNTLMFVRKDYLKKNSLLRKEFESTNMSQLSIVHPRTHLIAKPYYMIISKLPRLVIKFGKKIVDSHL